MCFQAALLDSLYGTERGLSARSEVRAEINELISQLEAVNPTPSPTEVGGGTKPAVAARMPPLGLTRLRRPMQTVLENLNGDWKLVYTSNSELMTILALSKLPFVEIGDITQKIDAVANTVENKVEAWGEMAPSI